MSNIKNLINKWKDWAKSNGKKYEDEYGDGWESFFPKWEILMKLGCEYMKNSPIKDLEVIEWLWIVSEETGEMQDCASENILDLLDVVKELCFSKNWKVRWQAYRALERSIEEDIKLFLAKNLEKEENEYVKNVIQDILNQKTKEVISVNPTSTKKAEKLLNLKKK